MASRKTVNSLTGTRSNVVTTGVQASMVGDREFFTRNYIKAMEIIFPPFYQDDDISVSGTVVGEIDSLLNSHIYCLSAISNILPVSAITTTTYSSISTFGGFKRFFNKQDSINSVRSFDFERDILLPKGKRWISFDTSTDFSDYLTNTLLPELSCALPDSGNPNLATLTASAYDNTSSGTHNYLINNMSWLYFLNRTDKNAGGVTNPSSFGLLEASTNVRNLIVNNLYYGKSIETTDLLKLFQEYVWRNYIDTNSAANNGLSALTGENILPAKYRITSSMAFAVLEGGRYNSSSTSYDDVREEIYTSGTQNLDKLKTLIDVAYSSKMYDIQDTYAQDAFQTFLTTSTNADGGSIITDTESNGPLMKFMKAMSWSIADRDAEAEELSFLIDIERCPDEFLEVLGELIGWNLIGTDPTRWRLQLRNATEIYKAKGTRRSIDLMLDTIFGTGAFNIVDTNLIEQFESYIPFLIYYSLATNSRYFASGVQGFSEEDSQQLGLGRYSATDHDLNLRVAVDKIIGELIGQYPDYFILGNEQFPLPRLFLSGTETPYTGPWHLLEDGRYRSGFIDNSDSLALEILNDPNFTFTYRGRELPFPPWDDINNYRNCEISPVFLNTLKRKLTCFGCTTAFSKQVTDYIADNTINQTDTERINNRWLIFTTSAEYPPNYEEVTKNIKVNNQDIVSYLPLWNGKSSHFKVIFESNSFDFTSNNLGVGTKYALQKVMRTMEEVIPAHAIPDVIVNVSSVEDIDLTLSSSFCVTMGLNHSASDGFAYGGSTGPMENFGACAVRMDGWTSSIDGQDDINDPAFAGGTYYASAADALKITGGTVQHNDAFTVLVPEAAGGLAGDVTISVLARTSMGSTPSPNQIHWYLDPASDAAKIANLKSAINGTADTTKVKFGSGITDGTTVGIKGLTASNGVTSVESFASLAADNSGVAGNDIALTDTMGTVLVNESALTNGKLAGGEVYILAPRTSLRRRSLQNVLPKQGLGLRDGTTVPGQYSLSAQSFVSSVGYNLLGFIPSTLSFEEVPLRRTNNNFGNLLAYPSAMPSVWSPCEILDSNNSYASVATSETFAARGITSPAGSACFDFGRRDQPAPIIDVIFDATRAFTEMDASSIVSGYYLSDGSVDPTWPSSTTTTKLTPNTLSSWFERPYMNVVQSIANQIEEGDTSETIDWITNFSFGTDMMRLYSTYQDYYLRQPLHLNLEALTASSLISHIFGPYIYNSDFRYDGSALATSSLLIASSYGNEFDISWGGGSGILSPCGVDVGSVSSVAVSDVFVNNYEWSNKFILSGIELVDASGDITNTTYTRPVFSVFRQSNDQDTGGGAQEPAWENNKFLVNSAAIKYTRPNVYSRLPRVRVKLLPTSEGNEKNFIVPETELELKIRAMNMNYNGRFVGGQSLGVWIHTGPESVTYRNTLGEYKTETVVWSYSPDNRWVRTSVPLIESGVGVSVVRSVSHVIPFDLLPIQAALNSGPVISTNTIPNFVISGNSGLTTPSLPAECDSDLGIINTGIEDPKWFADPRPGCDFSSSTVSMSNINEILFKDIVIPFSTDKDSFGGNGSILTSSTEYWIEIFAYNTDESKYFVFDSISIENKTLQKQAEIPSVWGTYPLAADQLVKVFKYFNDIADNEAGRDAFNTSAVYDLSGGSRMNYRSNIGMYVNTTGNANQITSVSIREN